MPDFRNGKALDQTKSRCAYLTVLMLLTASACTEARLTLSPASRLPKWFHAATTPARQDVSVTMDSFVMPWGRGATLYLHDRNGKQMARMRVSFDGLEPKSLKRNVGDSGTIPYPHYEVVRAGGITEVFEVRAAEPIFYVTDDPEVKRRLGLAE
jgi:hypothetical protein